MSGVDITIYNVVLCAKRTSRACPDEESFNLIDGISNIFTECQWDESCGKRVEKGLWSESSAIVACSDGRGKRRGSWVL